MRPLDQRSLTLISSRSWSLKSFTHRSTKAIRRMGRQWSSEKESGSSERTQAQLLCMCFENLRCIPQKTTWMALMICSSLVLKSTIWLWIKIQEKSAKNKSRKFWTRKSKTKNWEKINRNWPSRFRWILRKILMPIKLHKKSIMRRKSCFQKF